MHCIICNRSTTRQRQQSMRAVKSSGSTASSTKTTKHRRVVQSPRKRSSVAMVTMTTGGRVLTARRHCAAYLTRRLRKQGSTGASNGSVRETSTGNSGRSERRRWLIAMVASISVRPEVVAPKSRRYRRRRKLVDRQQ